MSPAVVANLALIFAVLATVMGAAAIMVCLYLAGQVATVMKLWSSEAVESEKNDL